MLKNKNHARMRQMQLQYHRAHPWGLSAGGLYIPHSYALKAPDELSYWDDVGFTLNGRRVIVWWQHPRNRYLELVEDAAYDAVGPSPRTAGLFAGSVPNYRKVGASRKKIVSYTCAPLADAVSAHYKRLHEVQDTLASVGVDEVVRASWRVRQLTWAVGVDLVAPLEVRNETELAAVAALARRLLTRQVTLEEVFPAYAYTREDWLREYVPRPG